jgi:cell division protein FtsB
MRPLVNLSSTPFRNRRLFWLVILALFVIPSYFGLEIIGTKTWMEQDIAERQANVNKLEIKLKNIDKPATTNVAISQDQNLQLLEARDLIARRAFSWTQLLNDIERNLPSTVRVLRIDIAQISPEERDGTIGVNKTKTTAVLNMNVIGKSSAEVTTMINRFFDSRRFKVFPLSQKSVEGLEDVLFELKVEYYPPTPGSRSGENNQVAVVEKKQQ